MLQNASKTYFSFRIIANFFLRISPSKQIPILTVKLSLYDASVSKNIDNVLSLQDDNHTFLKITDNELAVIGLFKS